VNVVIVNALTGQKIEREMNKTEIAQYEADQEATEQAASEAQAQAKAQAEATAAAITHAKTLGFTDQMISVMYPNLGAGNE